ncbi:hypothetical protein GH714_025581 [Hevea brasiliensis]|uniref:Cytochrome P450 n=1 Tax=Hevea brasiliensis TaxID=3981 RepID=A0A6A6KU66_HEVBR|nr:hypothetical protein GH714_025581 [Hevea brasiliensis]
MDFSSHLLAIPGVLALVLLYWYNLWRLRDQSHKSKGKLAPEVPGTLPIIGHIHLLGAEKTLARSLGRLADKYGPIFTIWLGVHRTVVVSNHDAIKECFTTNDKIVLIQLLSNHRLKSLRHVQVSEVNTLINDLYLLCKQGSTKIVISECFEHLTINMITRMIAGKRYFNSANAGNEQGKRIGELMKEYMYISGVFVPSDLIPSLWWMNFLGPVKTMKRLSKEYDSLMESWINEHKLKRLKMGDSENMEEDFIDVMLSVLEDEFFGHSRENIIKGTAMTLIIAGADTTSITLTWILSNLLNNRRALELAMEEIDLKVGKERCVESSDIENLVYVQAIVKETLRLYPPGPLAVPHEASEDCLIGGYHIPKGTRIFPNLWKLHRDPKIWKNPDEFIPERFLTNHANLDVTGQNFEYIPFGSGRRSCPGLNFAIQAIHLTLARLLQGFTLTTPLNEPVDMSEGLGITLPKATPLEIKIIPRLRPELYGC